MVLPAIVSLSFLLIADIDSPRGGLIHVKPENLVGVAESLRLGAYEGDPPVRHTELDGRAAEK
jgi:hypothetical protein